MVGGVVSVSYGELWLAGNYLMRNCGLSDSAERGTEYIRSLDLGCAVPEMTDALCTRGLDALDFFHRECGIGFQMIKGLPDYYWPVAPASMPEGRYFESEPFAAATLGDWRSRVRLSPAVTHSLTHNDILEGGGFFAQAGWDKAVMRRRDAADERCMGPGLMAQFLKACLDRRVEVVTDAEVVQLVYQHGRVEGVRATIGGRAETVRARRGVILASGGYDWSSELRRTFDFDPDHKSQVPPTITGDHFRLAGSLGARVASVPAMTRLGYARADGAQGRDKWVTAAIAGLPHAIIVNSKGSRFADESFQPAYSFASRAINGSLMRWSNYPCWMIFDEQFREKYAFKPGASADPGSATSPVAMAATLEELAVKCGIDPTGLESEVTRFNLFARRGLDEDFGRGERPWSNAMIGDRNSGPNPNLGEVASAPYWAIRLQTVGSGMGAAGLATDTSARVVNYDGEVLKGLYATGNAMALLDLGGGYQSGLANTRGMTFAFLGAIDAMD
jgi:3-oxosteroid 1-dehydrogenase